jgi:VanZ family protein
MIRKFTIYWLPPLLWMATIFLLSSRPSVSVTDEFASDFIIFKSLHMAEYAFLFVLIFRAFYHTTALGMEKLLQISFVLSVLYGALDELHQTFVPTRTGTLRDIFIDTVGISIMYGILRNNFKKLKKYL